MGYYDIPIYSARSYTGYGWYAPYTLDNRKTTVQKDEDIEDEVNNCVDPSGSEAFPYISFKRWHNGAEAKFTDCIYKSNLLGWGDNNGEPTTDGIVNAFNDINGVNWIQELYKHTYYYVKYGSSHIVDMNISINFENLQNKLRIKKEGMRYIISFLQSSISV
jgi:hypothetical protein